MSPGKPIRLLRHLLSALFTMFPAVIFAVASLVLSSGEYYYTSYLITSIAFLLVSIVLGFLLPFWFQRTRFQRPWTWIAVQGLLSWVFALAVLALLNVTPLCVGQDNGDGSNNLSLCIIQTVLVSFAFSPLVLIPLSVSSIAGGLILKALPGKENYDHHA